MPVLAFFVGLLLILLISQMSKITGKSCPEHSRAILDNSGFRSGFNKRSFLDGYSECDFIEIDPFEKDAKSDNETIKKMRLFDKKSLKCVKADYNRYIRKSEATHNKFGALELNEPIWNFWVNQRIFHSAPLTLNLLHNLLLEKYYEQEKCFLTTISNQPILMPIVEMRTTQLSDQQLIHLVVPMAVGIVIPLTASCFILPLVEERRSHMLRLQRMCGINMPTYWIVNFMWDYCIFLTYAALYAIILTFTSLEGFELYEKLLIFLLIIIYAFPGILMIYLLTIFSYATLTSSFLIALLVQIAPGISAYVLYWDVLESNRYFFFVASIFPAFSLLDGINKVYTATKENRDCQEKCMSNKGCNKDTMCEYLPGCCGDSFFQLEDPGLLPSILFMLGSLLVLMVLIICFEVRRSGTTFYTQDRLKLFSPVIYPYDDPVVVEVKKMIGATNLQDSLSKHYMVNQLEDYIPKAGEELNTISFELDKQMCLAVYGIRHSGKSHLAKQLTGEHGFRFGDIYVNGRELKLDYFGANEYLSYCPQDYGYFGVFTPRELLHLFCMMRCQKNKAVIHSLAMNLDMDDYMDKRINSLTVVVAAITFVTYITVCV